MPAPGQGAIEVTVAGRAPAHRAGVRVHRSRALDGRERTSRDGLPVTSVARTLLDVAPRLTTGELDRVVEHALVHGLETRRSLTELLERHRGERGARRLRSAVEGLTEPRLTRSEAERRLLALIRAARLPMPEANVHLAGHEVDLLWRRERLVLEVDGYAYHRGRLAFERDRRRDADLLAAGHRVLRVTWRQIAGEQEALIARLATTLAAS